MTDLTTQGYTENDYREIIDNAGFLAKDGVTITVQDALSTAGSPTKLQAVYTQIIQEAVQANLVTNRFVQTLRHDGKMESTSFRWFGMGNVPNVRRGENGEYPEFTMSVGSSSMVRAQFMQCGLVVKITEEMIRLNQWDIIKVHITQAAQQLALAKEKLVFENLDKVGVVVYDNANPTQALKGACTGRDIAGNKNGAITQMDIVEMYSQAMANGYEIDTMLIHPLAYPIFQKDPILRHQGFVSGNPRAYLNSNMSPVDAYTKSAVKKWRDQARTASGNGAILNADEIAQLSTGMGNLPAYSPVSGIQMIVSRHVPFDPVAQTTSIIMLDSTASVLINVQEDMKVDSWDEKAREHVVVRIKESYSVDILDQGRGVVVAKNVPLVANEIFVNPVVTITDLTP